MNILFMTLGPCIFGFKACFRPTIAIGRTHLKEKYKGILFVATRMMVTNNYFLLHLELGILRMIGHGHDF